MHRTKFVAVLMLLVFMNLISECISKCSNLYGGEPCNFLPAPPGKTPSCARPGMTYCEHPDHYPGQLISYLIQKWSFDHGTVITSETKEEFSSYFYPPPSTVYGPPPNDNNWQPEPIFIPKPQLAFQETGYSYVPPTLNYTIRSVKPLNFKYTDNFPIYTQRYNQQENYFKSLRENPFFPYSNDIWKRRALRMKRSLKKYENINNNRTNYINSREKRQSTVSGETLCPTRSQYVTPRAALNNKGNWMFVVNMPEMDNKITQLVKSETCVSQTCNGICSIPQGYSSKCEQKYVQKRLVALDGGGNQLYTDVFWFPSCCVCTISNT